MFLIEVSDVKKNIYSKIFPLIILIAAMFMSVGYATVNSVLMDIDGLVTIKKQEGVYITETKYNNSVSALEENKINNVFQTTVNFQVELSQTDSTSSITYDISVYNSSSYSYTYTGVIYGDEFYSNSNIGFEVSGLEENDILKSNEIKIFQVKFYYRNENNISNNKLESYLNFKFEKNNWQSITNYGMKNFEITNSGDGKFITANYTSVPNQYEKINLPLNNLKTGSLYQLTFTTSNDNTIITTGQYHTLVYGCTVMENPITDYLDPKKLIAYSGYNSGFLWKTLSVEEQTVTLTFRATAETMYWVWDLSLIEDKNGTLYIKDIGLKESTVPNDAYVDVPNTTIYQKEYVETGKAETLTIQKGTYITKADYDNLIVKIQTAGGYEFINIPIVNLTLGKEYTISFSNLTTNAVKNNLRYGAKVQSFKQEGGEQLITSSDYNITDISYVNEGQIVFTATSSTMYLV